jgi:hypothetical protein
VFVGVCERERGVTKMENFADVTPASCRELQLLRYRTSHAPTPDMPTNQCSLINEKACSDIR